jgi:Fe-S cluster assembly protein SufD
VNSVAAAVGEWPARNEATKYTRLSRLAKGPVADRAAGSSPLVLDGARRVDGSSRFFSGLPDGLSVETFEAGCEPPSFAGLAPQDALAGVNRREACGGLLVTVSAAFDEPLHLAWHGTGGRRAERLLLRLEAAASLTLIETFTGTPGEQHGNPVAEVLLGDGARLDHISWQNLPVEAAFTQAVGVRQGRDSSYRCWAVDLGAGLARRDLAIDLAEPGATCAFAGLMAPQAGEHVDHHLTVRHGAPHCRSAQQVRGIVSPTGRAVFTGRVVVAEGASGTVAEQLSRGLLLGDGAEFDSRPQLEIFTDDVVASHGSTCGQLDREALFFLRSRGLAEDQARALLAEAFGGAVIDDLPCAALADSIRAELTRRVAQ